VYEPPIRMGFFSTLIRCLFRICYGLAYGIVHAPFCYLGTMWMSCELLITTLFTSKFKWMSFMELIFQIIFGQLFTILYPIFLALKLVVDTIYPPFKLLSEDKIRLVRNNKFLQKQFKNSQEMRTFMDSLELSIVPQNTFVEKVLLGSLGRMSAACTIDSTMYIRHQLLSRKDVVGRLHIKRSHGFEILLRHEVVHCCQFYNCRGGTVGFLSVYFAQFLSKWICNGYQVNAAYHDIDAEKEAYENEKT